ncbi:MerC domain-containing protein [bacterium]|nr:MerC domain-containing protein [bacterium]
MNIKHAWYHYIGLSASFLCLIHCLALPLITPFLPLLRAHNHWLVESVFVTLITLSTLTIYKGFRAHKDPRSMIVGTVAFLMLFSSLFFAHNDLQMALSIVGSLLMTIAHYTNYKLCRIDKPCCDH